MGRYYFGTISGTFFSTIQESEDASKFKSPIIFPGPLRCYEYIKCSCFVKDIYLDYCNECYSSKEEHLAKLVEDELDEFKANKGLVYESNCIKYYFEKFELKYVQNKLEKLEKIIGEDVIKNLDIKLFNTKTDNPNSKTCFDYTINESYLENTPKKLFGLIATWCLGKQIEKSIQELGYCELYCEA